MDCHILNLSIETKIVILGLYVGSDSKYLVDGELYNCDLLTGNITKEKVR